MTTPKPEGLAVYWAFAWLMAALGALLMAAPNDWFGPSWHFFKSFPQNGFWMGVCCFNIGLWQLLLLWHTRVGGLKRRWLSLLFFLGGFAIWTGGVCITAAGLLGHQGLIDGLFMMIVGAHKIVLSNQIFRVQL